ncbi:hypothetical protein [Arthrobacter sp. lap29]|uniref:hypothetical protein n=1 Tax=Arthrobacter sp. lap29 TaxID=3056122 RepID=UPI0028F73365|nr:hypothetical protein [Arthrobacter sp. lap29]
MKDTSAHHSAARRPLTASGPTASPSWNILKRCLLVDGIAVLIMVVVAYVFTDVHGVLSVLFGSLLVIAFFGLSLLVGHLFSKRMPGAVMGIFVMTYFVKVVGFAAVLFALGTPTWLNKSWFAGAAVAAVLLWQATEVIIFSKQRFLIFDESAVEGSPAGTATTPDVTKDVADD